MAEIFSNGGWPQGYLGNEAFWRRISISMNAGRIDVPLLMQMADSEYLMSLNSYFSLRTFNKPVDLFVYQSENHIKSQPAHKLSVYERNICWFGFWLNVKSPQQCQTMPEWAHWLELRATAHRF